MKLGLTYDRVRNQAPRYLSDDVVRGLRPDVLRLPVHSLEELADRTRDLERLRVSAVLAVPLERWNANQQREAASQVAFCRWIVGVELGHEPRIQHPATYLETAAGFAENLHLAAGQRLAILNLGTLVEDTRAEGWFETLGEFLAGGDGVAPLVASMLAAHVAAVKVSAVGERWPSRRRAEAVVTLIRQVFGAPVFVEVGYTLGAELTWRESARAWLLRLLERRAWSSWSSRPRTLDLELLEAWLRAAWTHWHAAGASAFFVCRYLEPTSVFNAHTFGAAWRALRLASRPGVLGERWTAEL